MKLDPNFLVELKLKAFEKNLKEIIPVDDIDFKRKIINTKSAWRRFDEVVFLRYIGKNDINDEELYEFDVVEFWHIDDDVLQDESSSSNERKSLGVIRYGGANYPAFEIYRPHVLGWKQAHKCDFNIFSSDEYRFKRVGNFLVNQELVTD